MIPHTVLGQLIALGTILVALVVIPIQVAQITMLASRRYLLCGWPSFFALDILMFCIRAA